MPSVAEGVPQMVSLALQASMASGAKTVSGPQKPMMAASDDWAGIGAWPSCSVTLKVQVWVLAGLESMALTVTWNTEPAWTVRPGMVDSSTPAAGDWVRVKLDGQLSV